MTVKVMTGNCSCSSPLRIGDYRFRSDTVSGSSGDQMARTLLGLFAAATGALCSTAFGQDRPPVSVSPDPPPTAEGIGPPAPLVDHQNEIVVTAPGGEADMRVPSTADDKAAAAAAAARTPCAGCVVVSGASVRIGFGGPPPAPLMIDLKSIPEAPPGSDAARYAEE